MAVSTSHIQLYIHTRKCHVAKIRCVCRELNSNSQLLRNKKIEKNTRQRKKQSHAQDSIYEGSAICLRPRSCRDFTIIREEYKSAATVFPLSQKHGNNTTNPNHQ